METAEHVREATQYIADDMRVIARMYVGQIKCAPFANYDGDRTTSYGLVLSWMKREEEQQDLYPKIKRQLHYLMNTLKQRYSISELTEQWLDPQVLKKDELNLYRCGQHVYTIITFSEFIGDYHPLLRAIRTREPYTKGQLSLTSKTIIAAALKS